MKLALTLLLTFLFSISGAQSFRSLSSPEKCWIILHPLKALRARPVTKEVVRITDSVRKARTLDTLLTGGKLDAFRHGLWLSALASTIGRRQALKLGRAHEKGNLRQLRSGKKEDGSVPDQAAIQMDLLNNEIGVAFRCKGASATSLTQRIFRAVQDGRFYTLLRDSSGNFLDADGRIISGNGAARTLYPFVSCTPFR